MKAENSGPKELTRREMLSLSGVAVGGSALGGCTMGPQVGNVAAAHVFEGGACTCPQGSTCRWDHPAKPERYTYFDQLPPFHPYSDTPTTIPRLGADEMRITLLFQRRSRLTQRIGN